MKNNSNQKKSLLIGPAIAVLSILGYFITTWNIPTEVPCVPNNAVNYNGATNYWEDSEGNNIMYSSQEDNYEWCVK